jgi:hypothetical protein
LVIPGRSKPELDRRQPIDTIDRNQKAAVEFVTIGRDCVDLLARVWPFQKALGISATRVAANDEDFVVPCDCGLALDAEKARP